MINLWNNVINGLKREPAYLLAFSLALLIFTMGKDIRENQWLAALMIGGAFGLTAFSIYLVEITKRTSLYLSSQEERHSLSDLRGQRNAIRVVFEGLVDDQNPRCIVYSNTPVKQFFDHEGNEIEFPFKEEEKRVTTIPDTQGIARIHTLLHLGGKTELPRVLTAQDFTPQDWGSNLILIGSPNSNPKTADALQNFGSPFRFSNDMKSVVALDSTEGSWPNSLQETGELDYGIIVKLKLSMERETQRVYFVLAGIGPIGTLACCHFLYRNIELIHEKFTDSPFAYVVSVNRNFGYTSVKEEKSMAIGIYHNR